MGLTTFSTYMFFIFANFSIFGKCSEEEGPVVRTTVGIVRGVNEGNISMFLSIPYAKVDKENPFGPSLRYPKFKTIFDANKDVPLCPQLKGGTLDCLRLNIHVPRTAGSKGLLPILVWIHGGGFFERSGTKNELGPKFLLKHNVILATINYRLSIYGFMCLDDPAVVGNQGLKDQHAALKWIKDNIKAFGGDPNKITVAGESAGGISVDLHLQYDKERKFSQAILDSGVSANPRALVTPDYNAPFELANYMGFKISNKKENLKKTLKYLAETNTSEVMTAINELGLSFKPCVEKEFPGVDTFLTKKVLNSKVDLKNVSVMIGSAEEESLPSLAFVNLATYGNTFQDKLRTEFGLKDKFLENSEKIFRHFYIGDQDIKSNDTRSGVVAFQTDLFFQYPIERTFTKFREAGVDAVYRYLFTYVGGRNFIRTIFNITFGGAVHADDLGYLFDMALFPETPTEADQLMIDRITLLWTNFIKYGNPTPSGTSKLIPEWPAVNSDTEPYMDLGSELSIKSRPFEKRMALWDLFYTYWGLLKEDKCV